MELRAIDPERFGEAANDTQHGHGDAFCFGCKYKWIAVAPTGTTQLTCPRCHSDRGLWKFPFAPGVGQTVRVCNCGCELFYLTPDGHMCTNCGVYQRY